MSRYSALSVPALLLVSAPSAAALELDSLLPSGIPGFGTAPGITIASRLQRGDQPQGISLGDVTISPEIDAGAGYDSAPNGAAPPSAVLNFAPSLTAADPPAGIAAYAALQTASFPQSPGQNSIDYTLAAGQAAILPQNTITIAAALVHSQLSGFTLEPAPAAATGITGATFRARDDVSTGMMIVSPEISLARAVTAGPFAQTATETAAGLKWQIIPDGVLHLVAYLHATRLSFTEPAQNAADYTGLIGLSDTAEGLWDFRLAAGLTTRDPAHANATTIPIAEAAADWMPDDLTSLGLTAAHEIDDPDRIDTASYTITQAKISITHEYLRNVILSAAASLTHAAFFETPLIETITQTQAGIAWRLNAGLKLTAAYDFNDRQANRLRAANEHVATLTLAWSL